MLNCFCTERTPEACPIALVATPNYSEWLRAQPEAVQSWLNVTKFKAEAGTMRLLPDANGKLVRVVCGVADDKNFWGAGALPLYVPEGIYYLEQVDDAKLKDYALAWGLGAYQFTRYKKPLRESARLVLPEALRKEIDIIVSSLCMVRDWINTPADDMGPSQLAAAAQQVAEENGAQFKQIVGEELLKQNYAAIYTVGRASDDAPRLLDLRWGNAAHPKITLVGKGVCFDTGGLDLKGSSYMLLMRKDMAGSAHVLGLARMIMQLKLPVRLRVLVPAVENSVSGNAYRPGDIITSRKGLTIEVGNTDAEGRVVLADALAEAVTEKPELLIDISTLTGAARVALGPDLPAVFANQDNVVNEVIACGEKTEDPMWRLPLFNLYREYLNTSFADINNNSSEPYAGAIVAALFLKEFVPDEIPWLHFDLMAWNTRARPGKPAGGEAMVLRALLSYLQGRYT